MQQPITVTYTLEEVLTKLDNKLDNIQQDINSKFEKLDNKIDNIQKEITDLKVEVARVEEKVDGLGKRLDYQEFITRGVVIALVVAILGGLAKLFNIFPNL